MWKLPLHALVATALVAAVACGEEADPREASTSTTRLPAAQLWGELPSGWSSLPEPPFQSTDAVAIWTGRELLYWGGDTDSESRQLAEGAAYDAATERWRPLPAAPLSERSAAGAVWTGSEVLIWGGWARDGPRGSGAAFDFATERWRKLPDAPLSPRTPAAVVWTGEEMIVWGDRSRFASAQDGAAYDPAADSWRELPPAPVALNQAEAIWTGEEMIVFGALLDGNNHSDTRQAQGIAYHPEEDAWRVIAPYPLSPQASSIVWTGRLALAWDYELEAGLYDPIRDAWTELPDLPLDFGECYPTSARVGRAVFAWYCTLGAVFDPAERRWLHVPVPDAQPHGAPVSAGDVVLFPAAAYDGSRGEFLAYRP